VITFIGVNCKFLMRIGVIEEFEKDNYTIDSPDPIKAIKIRMEELQLRQKDLVGVIGTKSIVSEVLNRKRKLTVNMIRVL